MDLLDGQSVLIDQDPSFCRHGLYPKNPIFFVLETQDLVAKTKITERALKSAEVTTSNHHKIELAG